MSDKAEQEVKDSISDELERVRAMMKEVDEKIFKIIEILGTKLTPEVEDEPKDPSVLSAIDRQMVTVRGIQRSIHLMYPRLDAIISEVAKIE